jgi:hypothetical protein
VQSRFDVRMAMSNIANANTRNKIEIAFPIGSVYENTLCALYLQCEWVECGLGEAEMKQ